MSLVLDRLADEAALIDLLPSWRALWREAGAPPFQSPEWLLPWWRVFGNGALRAASLADESGLLGLLALYELSDAHGTRLLPLGAGITDTQDALLSPRAPLDAATRLLEAILDDSDCPCELTDVPPDASLRRVAPRGWRVAWTETDPCPVLELGSSLRESISPTAHRSLRMNRNRATRAGAWAVRDAGAGALPTLITLHERRWGGGVLADPAVVAFHRHAMAGLIAAGIARLSLLDIDGTPVAALLSLLSPGRILFYLSGYDPDHAEIGPGSVLFGAAIEQAIAEGRSEAHFLRGDEAYKRAWGAVARLNGTGRLSRA